MTTSIFTAQPGEGRVIPVDKLPPSVRARAEAIIARMDAASPGVTSAVITDPVITWYKIQEGKTPATAIFVTLRTGAATAILLWNGHTWVSGAATCTGYLQWGEPGAEPITEREGLALVEHLGGHTAEAKATIAKVAAKMQAITG